MILKENVKLVQKLQQHNYLIIYCIIQKSFCLKIRFFVFLDNFILVLSNFKNTPRSSFKYFESFDVIVVKKTNLLKVSLLLCSTTNHFFFFLTQGYCVKKG